MPPGMATGWGGAGKHSLQPGIPNRCHGLHRIHPCQWDATGAVTVVVPYTSRPSHTRLSPPPMREQKHNDDAPPTYMLDPWLALLL